MLTDSLVRHSITISIRNRSNPGTPTQPRRPDFIGVNHTGQMPVSMHTMHPVQAQPLLYSQAMGKPPYDHQVPGIHMNRQLLQQQQQAAQPPMMANQQPVYGSPQRRYLSEGELVRQGAELSYARSNNTVDNLRELAGSPQHSMYMWKDNSPGFNGNQPQAQFPGAVAQKQMMRTPGTMPPLPPMQQQPQQQPMQQYVNNPTSPTQQHSSIVANNIQRFNQVRLIHSLVEPIRPVSVLGAANGNVLLLLSQCLQVPIQTTPGGYHPALRGGVCVYPQQPSPQIKRKQTPTRPISFVVSRMFIDILQ